MAKNKIPKVTKPAGRPSKYSKEVADLICEEIASTSKSLRTICKSENLPSVGTVLKWLREDTEGFVAQYTRAKEEQADLMADEILEISDNSSNDMVSGGVNVQRDRLRIESRKWLASKLKPKSYGEKLDLTTKGEQIGVSINISDEAKEKLNEILESEY